MQKILRTKGFYIYISIICSYVVTAQDFRETAMLRSFQDSIAHVLEGVFIGDTLIGDPLEVAFQSLSPEQKKKVYQQNTTLHHKKYFSRKRLVNYYKAMVAATASVQLKNNKINAYLQLADQVITHENFSRIDIFFKKMISFFEYNAVYKDRAFQVSMLDENYDFIYEIPEVNNLLMDRIDENNDAISVVYEDNDNEDETNYLEDDNWDDSDEEIQLNDSRDALETDYPIWMEATVQPILTGAIVHFDNVSLLFKSSYDSVLILNTKGDWDIIGDTFVGSGGTFDWSIVDLNKDSVYFTFEDYNFKVSSFAIHAERGKLTHLGKLEEPVSGAFVFKGIFGKVSNRNYPSFTSFTNNAKLINLPEGMSYVGGFTIRGEKMNSLCLDEKEAVIDIIDADKKIITARSDFFKLEEPIFSADHAYVTIYQQNDSIYQPLSRFHYASENKTLTLSRGNTGHAPYFSSYFNMDFDADKLHWRTDTDTLSIYAYGGRGQAPLILESSDYYNAEDYRILTGFGFPFHPLVLVAKYALNNDIAEFYTSDLARDTQQSIGGIEMAMQLLSKKGMVDYDKKRELVTIKKELFNFYKASINEQDYDNIKIHSVKDNEDANAILLLNKGIFKIEGVETFKISDSLNVVIKPDSASIDILKNRTIRFDGSVTAGNFEITGQKFTFKYDDFNINLEHIDALEFYTMGTNARGQPIRRKVDNAMVGANIDSTALKQMGDKTRETATLYINRPDNKSGKKKDPSYPRLDESTGGIIYFDKETVLNGAYNKSVYYLVDPFKMDSLNAANSSAVSFEGSFISGIFPDFRQTIGIRGDNSLGFSHEVPSFGYPLYKGQGRLIGNINLDGKGIRSNGTIRYLSTTISSQDFIFYPDSVSGFGQGGKIEEEIMGQVSFPEVVLPTFRLKWLPKSDQFRLRNALTPFELYQNKVQVNGGLVVSRTGLSGNGTLHTRGFDASSASFSFSRSKFGGKHANIALQTTIVNKPALVGKNVYFDFNLDTEIANIGSEIIGDAALEFPYAQFKTSISNAKWDIKKGKVTMQKQPDVPIERTYFYTTKEELDSLNFNAEKAEYDIEAEELTVSGIPYIIVADAKIIPENNEIVILENAKINQLENAEIILDALNEYHHLIDGSINIISRTKFTGQATYRYINTEKDTFTINMTAFNLMPIEKVRARKKEVLQTVASGSVLEKDSLILGVRMQYKGDITMYASRPALELEGSIKLDIKNVDQWIKYRQTGYETDIYLDFDNAITEEGKPINAGMHFDDNYRLYSTFTHDKKSATDDDFFIPKGSLYYDRNDKSFRIENLKRASGEVLTGSAFVYDEDKDKIRFEGQVTFFESLKKESLIKASVIGSGNIEVDSIKMNSLIMINAKIQPQILQSMANDLREIVDTEDVPEGIGDPTELLYKLADIVPPEVIENFEKKSLATYTSLVSINSLTESIVFSNIDLLYHTEERSFYNTGKLGLSHIMNKDINGSFEGFMEIKHLEDGSPSFQFFLKATSDAWYYLGIKDRHLTLYSSNKLFNEMIVKRSKASSARFRLMLGSEEETLSYINRFRKQYYDIDTPYSLDKNVISDLEKTDDENKDDGF